MNRELAAPQLVSLELWELLCPVIRPLTLSWAGRDGFQNKRRRKPAVSPQSIFIA
ncbi:MAG: hypothetical protein ABFC84_06745 [Veillonellales bacterium]